jgi:NADH:ubiquinone oxidoreductase subunit C
MSAEQHLQSVLARFPSAYASIADGLLSVSVEPGSLRAVLTFFRDELRHDCLTFVTALDRPAENRIEAVYRLFSYDAKTAAVVRVKLDRNEARVDSASDIYRTAEWHERETAEMFGIEFAGHPDPRKLLLPDEIEGHPLRKDFSHPDMNPLPETRDVK